MPTYVVTGAAGFIGSHLAESLVGAGHGFTYVGDVVVATEAAMQAGTGMYNVGGGTEASLLEAIGILERLAGVPLDLVEGPAVPGDQRRTSADTTRIQTELDWQPQVSLEDGLRAQWEWVSGRVAAR